MLAQAGVGETQPSGQIRGKLPKFNSQALLMIDVEGRRLTSSFLK